MTEVITRTNFKMSGEIQNLQKIRALELEIAELR